MPGVALPVPVALPGVALPVPCIALPVPGIALPLPGVALPVPVVALPGVALPVPVVALPGVALPVPGIALPVPVVALPVPAADFAPATIPSAFGCRSERSRVGLVAAAVAEPHCLPVPVLPSFDAFCSVVLEASAASDGLAGHHCLSALAGAQLRLVVAFPSLDAFCSAAQGA